jgi:tripartite-type tricarboxylate transporter receptor subunit TctC
VPTLAEAGLGDFDLVPWNSWFAPKGTPPEIVDKLNAAIADILADAEVRKQLSVLGYETGTKMNPAEAAAFVETEARKWAELIRAFGITVE